MELPFQVLQAMLRMKTFMNLFLLTTGQESSQRIEDNTTLFRQTLNSNPNHRTDTMTRFQSRHLL